MASCLFTPGAVPRLLLTQWHSTSFTTDTVPNVPQASKAVMLSNRARQLNPDRRENFRILREAIQAHAAERKHLPRPLYMPRPGILCYEALRY